MSVVRYKVILARVNWVSAEYGLSNISLSLRTPSYEAGQPGNTWGPTQYEHLSTLRTLLFYTRGKSTHTKYHGEEVPKLGYFFPPYFM